MSNYGCKEKKKSPETLEMILTNDTNNNERKEVDKKIIINFSMVNYIDEFGVKCLEKKGSINKPINNQDKKINCVLIFLYFQVKHAYYIVCQDCCTTHKICSKCSKPSEELE